MCTALAPRIGYDITSAIAKTAYHENRTVRGIASELVGLDLDRVAARLGQPDLAAALREKEEACTRRALRRRWLQRKPLRPFGYRLLNEAGGRRHRVCFNSRLVARARGAVWASDF